MARKASRRRPGTSLVYRIINLENIMRPKIKTRPHQVSQKVIKLFGLVTVILGISAVFALVILVGIKEYEGYKAYKVTWDSQNECIAYMVRLGIERKDIYRSGDTCIIGGES